MSYIDEREDEFAGMPDPVDMWMDDYDEHFDQEEKRHRKLGDGSIQIDGEEYDDPAD